MNPEEFLAEKFIDMHCEHLDSGFKIMTPESDAFG